jgi:hypothetical protein
VGGDISRLHKPGKSYQRHNTAISRSDKQEPRKELERSRAVLDLLADPNYLGPYKYGYVRQADISAGSDRYHRESESVPDRGLANDSDNCEGPRPGLKEVTR